MGSSPFARTERGRGNSHGLFQCELGPPGFVPLCHYRDISPGRIYVSDVWSLALAQNGRRLPRPLFARASGLAVSLPSVTVVTSPQGEYTSPTFGRSHALRTAESSLDHLFQRELGPHGFVPLCHYRDFSLARIYVSDVWSLARSQNSRRLPRPLFSASFERTPNEGGGLLPPGRAARISLNISALGIFRVVKTATLISVKQLIHSNLQVARQNAETLTFCFHVNLFMRFSWAKVRNHKKRVNT